MAHPNFVEKTFTSGSKTTKFVNIFSLESFPLYGSYNIAACMHDHTCLPSPLGKLKGDCMIGWKGNERVWPVALWDHTYMHHLYCYVKAK